MIEEIHIICHQGSGAGRGKQILHEVIGYLGQHHFRAKIHITSYAGHATVLAQSLQNLARLIVIGGDGTLHEVVSGLFHLENPPALLYIPAGTGNDFARAWHPNRTVQESIAQLLTDRAVQVPIMRITDLKTAQQMVAINSFGFGFDGTVNYHAKKLKLNQLLSKVKLNKLSYFTSTFASIPDLKAFDVKVMHPQLMTIPQCYLLSVMTNPFFGGGIQLDPLGRAQDLELSVIAVHSVTPKRLAKLLWQVFVSKDLHLSPYVQRITATSLELTLNQKVKGQIDGEILEVDQVHYQVEMMTYPFIVSVN